MSTGSYAFAFTSRSYWKKTSARYYHELFSDPKACEDALAFTTGQVPSQAELAEFQTHEKNVYHQLASFKRWNAPLILIAVPLLAIVAVWPLIKTALGIEDIWLTQGLKLVMIGISTYLIYLYRKLKHKQTRGEDVLRRTAQVLETARSKINRLDHATRKNANQRAMILLGRNYFREWKNCATLDSQMSTTRRMAGTSNPSDESATNFRISSLMRDIAIKLYSYRNLRMAFLSSVAASLVLIVCYQLGMLPDRWFDHTGWESVYFTALFAGLVFLFIKLDDQYKNKMHDMYIAVGEALHHSDKSFEHRFDQLRDDVRRIDSGMEA